jgi:hypothetical protein
VTGKVFLDHSIAGTHANSVKSMQSIPGGMHDVIPLCFCTADSTHIEVDSRYPRRFSILDQSALAQHNHTATQILDGHHIVTYKENSSA